MTDLRKIIYDKRSLSGALVQAAGTFLDKPTEEKTWSEIESMRRELAVIRTRTNEYLSEVENFLMENCPDWQSQWDLAHELYSPYNEPYSPEEIDIESLSSEFQEKGLNKELADQLATSIKYPVE